MKIVIETIPHKDQRYDTVGDWWIDAEGTWQIRVSQIKTDYGRSFWWAAEFLVALHELVEMAACLQHGITQERVDEFDKNWKYHGDTDEPGDDMDAPYYAEHQFACGIERLMAAQLGVTWHNYETVIDQFSLS